jgi:hypothetical protein
MIFERGFFKAETLQKKSITEALNETRTYSFKGRHEYKTTIFISHKHGDLEDVEELKGVMELLEQYGAKIYVDSMDNRLPEQTTGETATRLKEVIKHCNKFVLLATKKAVQSIWCNWELGIGDVHKYKKNIAILPIKEKGESDYSFIGYEYLQIYRSISYRDKAMNNYRGNYIEKGYYINEPDSFTIIPLKDWLKGY